MRGEPESGTAWRSPPSSGSDHVDRGALRRPASQEAREYPPVSDADEVVAAAAELKVVRGTLDGGCDGLHRAHVWTSRKRNTRGFGRA